RRQCSPARVALACALAAAGLLAGAFDQPLRAAEPDRPDTSLTSVPGDVAFYSSFLRVREQFDAVAQSKAVAKLKDLAVTQKALQRLHEEIQRAGSPYAGFHALLDTPDVKELLAFLGDAVSNEVFLYGTSSWADVLELLPR